MPLSKESVSVREKLIQPLFIKIFRNQIGVSQISSFLTFMTL